MTSPGTPPAKPVLKAGWIELLCWLVGLRRRYRVQGRSMEPLLHADQEVLIHPRARLRVGDVVVARHPHRSNVHLIKRLCAFDAQADSWLEGLNPAESTDSRTLGSIPSTLILGRVTSHL